MAGNRHIVLFVRPIKELFTAVTHRLQYTQETVATARQEQREYDRDYNTFNGFWD